MARFVDVESVEKFINKQKNSNTTNKTIQDVKLLLEFLRRKNETHGIHEINPSKLNEYISEFIVSVRKKDVWERIRTDNFAGDVFKYRTLFTREILPEIAH